MYVSAALAVAAAILSWRLLAAHEDIGRLESAIDRARDVNQSQVATIDHLNTRLTDLIAQREADEAAAEQAVAEALRQREELQVALENERNEREIIYENDPEAADWADQPVPSAIVSRLRF